MTSRVTDAYRRGWQPAELLRQARREAPPSVAVIATLAVAAEHRSRPDRAYHPRWLDHVAGLELPDEGVESGWLVAALAEHPSITTADLRSLVAAWSGLPELPCLLPPPAGIDLPLAVELLDSLGPDPVLDKVRALLAKAEATTFAAEADAFTAKAHQLMARHLIDEALVAASSRPSNATRTHPITIRLPIDAPYETPKATLIAVVADAGGCRAVHHSALGLTSVVGHASDVAAVEVLFTSLLVQAQSAMAEQARLGPTHRSRGFRSSFLRAYAFRVGERLREINAEVQQSVEADTGTSLVPVLDQRASEVREVFDQLFTKVIPGRAPRQWDHHGVVSGRSAADRAQLDTAAVSSAKRQPAVPGPSATSG
ncbi:MAG: DUF2786 domain-containing protein [Acidimicrobiales bacterium]